MNAPASIRLIGPLSVRAEPATHVLNELTDAISQGDGRRVAFANTHLLYHVLKSRDLAETLSSFVVLNDGIGLTVTARLICGAGFPENLNGTDLTPRLLSAAPSGAKLFLYGARPEVITRAATKIAADHAQLVVCGAQHGYAQECEETLLAKIELAAPQIVLVALGNPKQERFIARAAERLPKATFIGVGALFDFMAQAAPRAPRWMRTLRLEWLFRLSREPRRLWRRYTVELIVVATELLRLHLAHRRIEAAR